MVFLPAFRWPCWGVQPHWGVLTCITQGVTVPHPVPQPSSTDHSSFLTAESFKEFAELLHEVELERSMMVRRWELGSVIPECQITATAPCASVSGFSSEGSWEHWECALYSSGPWALSMGGHSNRCGGLWLSQAAQAGPEPQACSWRGCSPAASVGKPRVKE